ncbi:MAG: substrate-binding domain-containing protein, partial [Puniceicoccales bacterium]
SLAFRGSDRVSEATRQKVLEAADRLGYRPNPMVQTLMANLRATRKVEMHSVIAWVTTFDTEDGWANSWVFQKYFEGAVRRARHLGYRIEPFWAREKGMTGERLSGILRARGINGVIIPPVPSSFESLDLDWSLFASATIGHSFQEPALHRVAANLSEAMALVLEKCEKAGYERIGYVTPAETDERVKHSWMSVYLAWQKFLPRKKVVPMLYVKDTEKIEDRLGAWLEKNKPDLIITANRELLVWLPQMFNQKIPEDIGVVVLAKHIEDHYIDQATGINQRDSAVGAAAVDMVVAQMQRNEIGLPDHPNVLLISGVWENGGTTRNELESLEAPRKPRKGEASKAKEKKA